MKTLLILLALLMSANAQATNVLYVRSSDVLTGAPAIFYATNEHDSACKGYWYKAEIIDNDGSRMMRPTFCWTMVGIGDQGQYLGFQVLALDTGNVVTDVTLYPVIGSGNAMEPIEAEAYIANPILFHKWLLASYAAHPHP